MTFPIYGNIKFMFQSTNQINCICYILLYYAVLSTRYHYIILYSSFQLPASIIFTDLNISLNPQSLIFVNLKFEAPTSLRVKWSVVPLWSHQPDAKGCSATRTACESQRKASSKIICMFGAENVLNMIMMMMMVIDDDDCYFDIENQAMNHETIWGVQILTRSLQVPKILQFGSKNFSLFSSSIYSKYICNI
jgi:hypothetical protein